MSDERIRRLERQAAADGDVEVGARLLQERLRTDPTLHRKGEMAAYLGDEISQTMFSGTVVCASCTYEIAFSWADTRDTCTCGRKDDHFQRWTAGLANIGAQSEEVACLEVTRCGEHVNACVVEGCTNGKVKRSVPDQEFLVRCAVAAARCAERADMEHRVEEARRYEGEDHGTVWANQKALKAIKAAEVWLDCPCDEHQKAWHMASTGTGASEWWPSPAFSMRQAIQASAQLAKPEAVRSAIRKDVVPWLLS